MNKDKLKSIISKKARGNNDNKEIIDFKNLVLAIKNTFKYRQTELNVEKIKVQLDDMKSNKKLIKLWRNFQITAPYSNKINFDFLFDTLYFITDLLVSK